MDGAGGANALISPHDHCRSRPGAYGPVPRPRPRTLFIRLAFRGSAATFELWLSSDTPLENNTGVPNVQVIKCYESQMLREAKCYERA